MWLIVTKKFFFKFTTIDHIVAMKLNTFQVDELKLNCSGYTRIQKNFTKEIATLFINN